MDGGCEIMHGWMCWEETYVGRTGMSDDFRVGGADVGELSLLRGPPAVRVVAAPPRAKRGLCSTNARGHACVVPLLHAATCVSHLSSPHAMARSHLVSRSLELSLSPTASASCSFAFAWGAPALPLRCLDRGGRRCGQAIATPPPPAGVSARRSSLHHGPHQAQRAMLRPLRQLRRLPSVSQHCSHGLGGLDGRGAQRGQVGHAQPHLCARPSQGPSDAALRRGEVGGGGGGGTTDAWLVAVLAA